MMTLEEVMALTADPREAGRTFVWVHEDGNELVARWQGEEYRADNMFALDSRLTAAGVPTPRNLCLVSPEDWEALVEA